MHVPVAVMSMQNVVGPLQVDETIRSTPFLQSVPGMRQTLV